MRSAAFAYWLENFHMVSTVWSSGSSDSWYQLLL